MRVLRIFLLVRIEMGMLGRIELEPGVESRARDPLWGFGGERPVSCGLCPVVDPRVLGAPHPTSSTLA